MAFGRSMGSRNRNSWGPTSISMGFQRRVPDEDYAEECTERMMNAQNRQLDPLKEDLADWLNKTLGKSSKDKEVNVRRYIFLMNNLLVIQYNKFNYHFYFFFFNINTNKTNLILIETSWFNSK